MWLNALKKMSTFLLEVHTTGAFVLCRRTEYGISASPRYQLRFRARRLKLSCRINNELLYLYSTFVPAGRFPNSATNTNA